MYEMDKIVAHEQTFQHRYFRWPILRALYIYVSERKKKEIDNHLRKIDGEGAEDGNE